MQIVDLYVAFHFRTSLRESVFTSMGHVEAFGLNIDETWFFFDPNRYRLDLRLHHRHDEIADEITRVQTQSRLILRVDPAPGKPIPPFCLMTCAAQCAHLAGVRAFTPWGLERKLRDIGATEVFHGKESQRRSRRHEGARA